MSYSAFTTVQLNGKKKNRYKNACFLGKKKNAIKGMKSWSFGKKESDGNNSSIKMTDRG